MLSEIPPSSHKYKLSGTQGQIRRSTPGFTSPMAAYRVQWGVHYAGRMWFGVCAQVMNDVRRNKILSIDYFRVN